MSRLTLEDHLRRATRNFTARLPEEQVLSLGRDLTRELARAHGEVPPRHPELELSAIAMEEGRPRLEGTGSAGDAAEDLFRLGALLCWLGSGSRPEVSWRLDGPPTGGFSSLQRRAAVASLAAPSRSQRFASAAESAEALEAALSASEDAPAPWPTFRGDAGRTGARPAAGPAASLAVVWDARIGAVLASPALTPGLVLAPTADGRLVFLDRRSARTVHEVRLGSAIESSPSLAGGLAWMGTDDGELVGVDTARGEARHRLRLGQLVRSSPLTVEDRVLVGVVESKTAGAMVAVAASTGKPVWTRKLGAVFSSPALKGSLVLAGSDDGFLHALDLAKGSVVWSQQVGTKLRATPAVADEVAVVGDFGGRLVAVALKDGARLWTREIGHPLYSSPCLAAGLAVVGCHEGHVHAVDLGSGTPRFEAETKGPVVSSAAAAGDRFLVASTDGGLYLLDATGRVAHRSALTRTAVQSSPALDGELAFVGSGEGVHARRLAP